MSTPQSIRLDANSRDLDIAGGVVVKKTVTFSGGTTDAIGDDGGALDPFTIFTVTGVVLARVFGVVTTNLAGATATLEVGVANGTAEIIPQSTATDLVDGDIWVDATPTTKTEALPAQKIVESNIIGTVGTANITAGVIDFYCIYYPVSDDASVVAG